MPKHGFEFDSEQLRKIQAALNTHIKLLDRRLALVPVADKVMMETDQIMQDWRQLKANIEIGLIRLEAVEESA